MPRQNNNSTNSSAEDAKLPLEQSQPEETPAESPSATETANEAVSEASPAAAPQVASSAPAPTADPATSDPPVGLDLANKQEAAAAAVLRWQDYRASQLAECSVVMLGSVAGSTPSDSTTGLPPEFSLKAGDRIAVSYRLADEWEAAGLCRILDEN